MIVSCNEPLDSSSRSVNETVNGSHHFTVRGYSLAKGMGPGKFISSDTFTICGFDWAIYFYPDGKNPEDTSTYVSVFITLASEVTDVRALFEITLLDQSGKGKHKVHSHFDRALESGPYTLKHRGSMWGYKRFFKRSALESSNFLKDDCLSMHCTVGVVRSRIEVHSIPILPWDIGQSLMCLLDCEVGCDLVFQVGEESFKAHKLILSARSPVFKAQFHGPAGNPHTDKVIVEDVEPFAFKAMLQFIYCDELPCFDELTCTSCARVLQHLLVAADRFGLDRLKQLCEAKLSEDMTSVTVATTLSIAEQHHSPHLKAQCLQFVATNLGVVMQSEGFRYLEQSCPLLISELLESVALVNPSRRLRSR